MNRKYLLLFLLLLPIVVKADAINTTNKWSWGETLGWVNWLPANAPTAVDVSNTQITGHVWSQDKGWINLQPTNGGVVNTCMGDVSGNAWGEGIGWIDMSGVSINPLTGFFSGTATTDSSGDLVFSGTNFALQTDWRCQAFPTDTDGDGLPDSLEGTIPSDANDADAPYVGGNQDTDGDGITNAIEAYLGANGGTAAPGTTLQTDTDGDGLPDALEIMGDLNPFDANSPLASGANDADGDGITDAVENWLENLGGQIAPNTTPQTDTDGDGVPDATEVAISANAFDVNSPANAGSGDADTDGVTDAQEVAIEILGGTVFPNTTPQTDTDGDGAPDYLELLAGTALNNVNEPLISGGSDTDGDGVSNALENLACVVFVSLDNCPIVANTEVTPQQDTDNDGLPDVTEILAGYDPQDINAPLLSGGDDVDSDNITNAVEYYLEEIGGQTAPNTQPQTDTDGDGVPDWLEVAFGSNPVSSSSPVANGGADADADGVTNAAEFYLEANGGQTAPNTTVFTDTDGDGLPDALELVIGADPVNQNSPSLSGNTDTDVDGVTNAVEAYLETIGGATAPNTTPATDSDGDGLPDATEVGNGTDPVNANSPTNNGGADTDNDGITDAIEAYLESLGGETAPNTTPTTNTDGDDYTDIEEIALGSDPTDADSPVPDTDNDGVPDHIEVLIGTDPNLPDTNSNGAGDSNNDLDNISPLIEIQAPNNGDGNNDGLIDAAQARVASIPNVVTGNTFNTLEASNCTQLKGFTNLPENSVAADLTYNYPLGLWDFSVDCGAPGATAFFKFYLDDLYDTSNWEYKKYRAVQNEYTDMSSQVAYGTATVGAKTVTTISFSITDGGPFDGDGVANGTIVDPSGPSINTQPFIETSDPTYVPSVSTSTTGRYAGQTRAEYQETQQYADAGVTKHTFEEAYAHSQENVAKLNAGRDREILTYVDKYGKERFMGYQAGKIATADMETSQDRLAYRGTRINDTESVLLARQKAEGALLSSASFIGPQPKAKVALFKDINPKQDSYQAVMDVFSTGLMTPVEEEFRPFKGVNQGDIFSSLLALSGTWMDMTLVLEDPTVILNIFNDETYQNRNLLANPFEILDIQNLIVQNFNVPDFTFKRKNRLSIAQGLSTLLRDLNPGAFLSAEESKTLDAKIKQRLGRNSGVSDVDTIRNRTLQGIDRSILKEVARERYDFEYADEENPGWNPYRESGRAAIKGKNQTIIKGLYPSPNFEKDRVIQKNIKDVTETSNNTNSLQ